MSINSTITLETSFIVRKAGLWEIRGLRGPASFMCMFVLLQCLSGRISKDIVRVYDNPPKWKIKSKAHRTHWPWNMRHCWQYCHHNWHGICINQSVQNDAVLVTDKKGKGKVGQADQKPKREESPRAINVPAQRIYSKGEEEDKIKGQRMTKESGSVNGLKLYNKFTALDMVDDQDCFTAVWGH